MKKLEYSKVQEYPRKIGCFIFIQFDTTNENQHDLIFFLLQIFNDTKKISSSVQKNKFLTSSDGVVTLHASFFKNSRSQMFSKIDVLKNFAKIQKNGAFLSKKLLAPRKRLRNSCSPVNFVKFLQNTSKLLFPRFEKVTIKIDINKIHTIKFI